MYLLPWSSLCAGSWVCWSVLAAQLLFASEDKGKGGKRGVVRACLVPKVGLSGGARRKAVWWLRQPTASGTTVVSL